MKGLILIALLTAFSFTTKAQTGSDSVKSVRDYIIENENKRNTPPNVVKPGLKKISPSDATDNAKKTEKKKKCCLFCKKKKKR